MIRTALAILFCIAFGGDALAQATCLGDRCQPVSGTFGTITSIAISGQASAVNIGLTPLTPVQASTVTVLPFAPTYNNGSSGNGATLTATQNGALTINGYSVAFGNRVLINNQALAYTNGLYTVLAAGGASSTYQLVRTTDASSGSQLFHGISVIDQNTGSSWVLMTNQPIALGSTNLSFSQYTVSAQSSTATGPINVRSPPYSATGDGSTDDTSAITHAIADAACTRPIYFPPGTYITTGLTASCFRWYGNYGLSIIKMKAGAAGANLVSLGPATTLNVSNGFNYMTGMWFDCSSIAPGCVFISNVRETIIENMFIQNSSGTCFSTHSYVDGTNTNLTFNTYRNILAAGCVVAAFDFVGEKDSSMDQLQASSGGDGFIFDRFNSTALSDCADCNEQNSIGSLFSTGNTGNSLVLKGIIRTNVQSLLSILNGGCGLAVSIPTVASSARNDIHMTAFTSRADVAGGICMDGNAWLQDATFTDVLVTGQGVSTTGITLTGVARVGFGNVTVESTLSIPVLIKSGTPGGGLTQSSNVMIDTLILNGNGSVAATDNSGLEIADSSTKIMVDSMNAADSFTTGAGVGGGYEVNVSANSTAIIGSAYLTPAAPGGLYAGGNGLRMNSVNGVPFTGSGDGTAVSACGTNPSFNGTQTRGAITVGTADPASCTLTYQLAYTNHAFCQVTSRSNLPFTTTVSATTLVINKNGTDLSGTVMDIQCGGY